MTSYPVFNDVITTYVDYMTSVLDPISIYIDKKDLGWLEYVLYRIPHFKNAQFS